MLYAEDTTGAVIAGFKIFTDGQLTGAQAREIETTLEQLDETYDHGIRLIVPGDTSYLESDPDSNIPADYIALGLTVVSDRTYQPREVSVEAVEAALQGVRDLPADFWEALAQKVPALADFTAGEPKTYLTSFGPLAQACLVAGVLVPREQSATATYDFFNVQDMYQQSSSDGVDGVLVNAVQFSSVSTTDLSEEAVAGYLAKADQLDEPKLYMTVRYD